MSDDSLPIRKKLSLKIKRDKKPLEHQQKKPSEWPTKILPK